MSLETVVIEPKQTAKASVIWLHGLGADGHDFIPAMPQLGLPVNHAIRFIFPHAPIRPVTLNQGMQMRAWYDIAGFSLQQSEDEAGMRASQALIDELILQEIAAGIPAQAIFLVGFSQGGAMALHTGLRFPQPLAGIIGLSCYLPLVSRLAHEASPANQSIPILMTHGEHDTIVPLRYAQLSCNYLRQLGYQVTWQTYPMAHEVCAPLLQLIGQRLASLHSFA
jgi:phospholipase/carboxylesterase